MSVRVNVYNFREAETTRMFDNVLATTGGVNRWFHHRARRPSSTSHPPRPHVAPLPCHRSQRGPGGVTVVGRLTS
jgi:hypothetical protein